MTVAVITSIYGGYDWLKAPTEQSVPCEFVCVSDQPLDAAGWTTVVEPRPNLNARTAAKVAKCVPSFYANTDVLIWVDGSATVGHTDFVAMCLDALGDGQIAQWIHPERDCIYEETEVSKAYGKYGGQPLDAQADHYRKQNYPEHGGLWATGCIVSRNTSRIAEFGTSWLTEQARWTFQDQISQPPLLRAMNMEPRPLPEGLWANRWLGFGHHLL